MHSGGEIMRTIKSDFELIKKTYSGIIAAPADDIPTLCKAFLPLAKAYGAYYISASIPLKNARHQTVILYGEENYALGIPEDARITEYEGRSYAGGRTLIRWVSLPDAVIDDDILSDIKFICCAACTFCERARLSSAAHSFFYYDNITGLPNINGIMRFASSIAGDRIADRYCAACINIIGYHYINQKIGYTQGTRLLKLYGAILGKMLDSDEFIGRMGGNSFVVIFKKTNLEKMLAAFNGTRVRSRSDLSSVTFTFQARAGIFEINEADIYVDKILNYCSSSLTYAKLYSRNNIVFYTPDVEQRVDEYTEYTQRFRSAMENGDFFVDYQPKVYTEGDEIYGAEALVRWRYDGRVIYPGDFIAILEKAHLISELDLFVLERTCRDLRRWIDKGIRPVKISVNLSNEHLWDDDIIDRIAQTVDKYYVDHKLIEIEMTETADIREIPKLIAFVDGLHKYGFTVAMDDFGTGYSSLQILQNVCVDVIKIDKTFITEAEVDSESRENIILKHIIKMASELGIEIVAEGVETDAQRENLKQHKCFRIQGYIYDKPLSEREFVSRLS